MEEPRWAPEGRCLGLSQLRASASLGGLVGGKGLQGGGVLSWVLGAAAGRAQVPLPVFQEQPVEAPQKRQTGVPCARATPSHLLCRQPTLPQKRPVSFRSRAATHPPGASHTCQGIGPGTHGIPWGLLSWLVIRRTPQIFTEHLLGASLPAPGAPSTREVAQGSLVENKPSEFDGIPGSVGDSWS